MKNIYIVPTEKPSRLSDCHDNKLHLDDVRYLRNYQNIYITSDNADINENDYIITKDGRLVEVSYLLSKDLEGASKIILTTDQDLIKDGVWGIEDGFLEWFVKNPTCEYVELKGYAIILPGESCDCDNKCDTCKEEEPKQFKGRGMLHYSGKIIGGEPKQENTAEYIDRHLVEAMVEVAKQKIYSEEEVEDLIYKVCGTVARLQGITLNGNHIDTAYKQFKNK